MNFTSLFRNGNRCCNVAVRNKSTAPSTWKYCLDSVKQYDYENFISLILLKSNARSTALAVRSFNIEIARIPEQVSQKNIGLMRLHFWEEAIEKCYSKDQSKVPQHPVAIELFKAINQSSLTKRYFQNLINCRKEQFNVSAFSNLSNMEKYSEQSVSNVYYLILEGCGVKNLNADHAASHLGKAQGIVQQLRSVPYAKVLNIVAIPQDILIKNKVSHENILRGKSSKELSDCVYEVASTAHRHLGTSKKLLDQIPKECADAFLPVIIVDSFLERLQKVDYDIFHPSLKHRSWNVMPKLWFSHFKNRYLK